MTRDTFPFLPLLRLSFILFLPASPALPLSPVDPVVTRLRDAGMLEARFVQTDHWALTLVDEVSGGTVVLAPPNLFRLEYADPADRVFGYDGETLYTIEPETMQVVVHGGGGPGSFLHLLETAADPDTAVRTELGGDSVLVELEGDFGEGITRMSVGFTTSDSLPWFFETVDCNGNRTSWLFSGFTVHDSVDRSLFDLDVPAGYELLDAGAM